MRDSASGYWFKTPWAFMNPEMSRRLNQTEKVLLLAFLYCDNRYCEEPGDWFFTYNSVLAKMVGVKETALRSAKAKLEKEGFISAECRSVSFSDTNVKQVMYYKVNFDAFPKDIDSTEKTGYSEFDPDEDDCELPF